MRFAVTPLALSIALLAVPAFAQNNGVTDSNGHYGQSTEQYNSGVQHDGYARNKNQANTENSTTSRFADAQNGNQRDNEGITSDTQQKIRQSLEQNGFRNVRIMPEAFIIRAQAPDGSHVVMEVSPDHFAEVVRSNTGSGSSTNTERMNQSEPNSAGSAGSVGSDTNNRTGTDTGTGNMQR